MSATAILAASVSLAAAAGAALTRLRRTEESMPDSAVELIV